MDELKWELLAEVYGRMEAELIQSYLEAHGISVELFQEAVGHHIYPTTLDGMGRVQIFVSKENARKAHNLFERQQFFALEEPVILAEDFLRHAIDAAEIAAIGDRNAQVAQRTAQPVSTVGRNLGGNRG